MKLKRVWDTTEKKIARVPWANWKPCQVWYKVEEEKFYKQDINGLVEITDEEFNVYWPNWKAMDSDDVLGYYDTNEPTELFTLEDWDVTVTFVSDPEGWIFKDAVGNEIESVDFPAGSIITTTESEIYLGSLKGEQEWIAIAMPPAWNYSFIERQLDGESLKDDVEYTIEDDTMLTAIWHPSER